jgi:hypothetical protein
VNNQNDCRLPTIFIYLKKNCYLLSDRELRLSLSLSEELLLDELPAELRLSLLVFEGAEILRVSLLRPEFSVRTFDGAEGRFMFARLPEEDDSLLTTSLLPSLMEGRLSDRDSIVRLLDSLRTSFTGVKRMELPFERTSGAVWRRLLSRPGSLFQFFCYLTTNILVSAAIIILCTASCYIGTFNPNSVLYKTLFLLDELPLRFE